SFGQRQVRAQTPSSPPPISSPHVHHSPPTPCHRRAIDPRAERTPSPHPQDSAQDSPTARAPASRRESRKEPLGPEENPRPATRHHGHTRPPQHPARAHPVVRQPRPTLR